MHHTSAGFRQSLKQVLPNCSKSHYNKIYLGCVALGLVKLGRGLQFMSVNLTPHGPPIRNVTVRKGGGVRGHSSVMPQSHWAPGTPRFTPVHGPG